MKFHIFYFKELESTNTTAVEYAAQGFPEGTVITADYQSRGRGKPGRRWASPPGKNLLFSVLLRPAAPAHRIPLLTQIACRSVAKILKNKYNIASRFKRPNDILVRNKKICGVLVESSSRAWAVEYVIIGIGLNVNAGAKELLSRAISMCAIAKKEINRKKLLKEILLQLKADLGNTPL